jgi:hypothetical protein
MYKLLTALIISAFAFGAQAASHAGGAPMKADAAKQAAPAKKKMAKKAPKKKAAAADAVKK